MKRSIDFYFNDTSNWGKFSEAAMLGGRERATVAIAEQLAKRGHDVSIYSPQADHQKHNGVHYFTTASFLDVGGGSVLIAVNGYEVVQQVHYDAKVAWIQTGLPSVASLLQDLDAVVVNSEAKAMYLNGPNHGLLRPPKLKVIGNGVDLAWWDGATPDRVPGRLIYSQSPDRGLHHILRWWPELKRRLPQLTLHVTYSIDRIYDFKWHHELRAEMCRAIDQGKSLPDVTFLGVLSAEDYRRELKEAELYVFPCDPGNFGETFSIGCMEACASFTPILGSGDVSIDEMYGNVAHIIRGPIYDGEWVNKIEELMTNLVERISLAGRARRLAERYTWELLAIEWETMLAGLS